MDLLHTGTVAALGVASGVLDGTNWVKPINIGTATAPMNIAPGAIAEGAGLVVGLAMQLWMPMTLPKVADGLFDGGVALVARRVSHNAALIYGTDATRPTDWNKLPTTVFSLNTPSAAAAPMRPLIGNVYGTPRQSLT